MSEPQSVLCFGSVYWDDPFITPQQVARQLGNWYDVLYVEPSPSYVYLREAGRNRRWLRAGRSPRLVAPGVHVYTPPPMLPLKTRSPIVNTISQRWVRPFVQGALRSLGLDAPVLLTYLPHVHVSVGAYGERLVCYYCIDDMRTLSRVINPAVVAGYERRMVEKAHLVFTTARSLYAHFASMHPDVHLVPNGSDPDLYSRALNDTLPVAPRIAGLPRPILGFSGLVDFRLDQDLLASVARAKPQWSFVFVGPVRTSVAGLKRLENIYFVETQPIERLPAFFKGFDVALIPYVIGPMVRSIYPTKLNDYLGAGLPVISSRLPELADCPSDLVAQVDTPAEFIQAAERMLATRGDGDSIARRVSFARGNSWHSRAKVIAACIDEKLKG